MHNSNSVLTYLKDGLFWYRVILNTIEINETFICKYCEKQPLIFVSKYVFQSLNLGR